MERTMASPHSLAMLMPPSSSLGSRSICGKPYPSTHRNSPVLASMAASALFSWKEMSTRSPSGANTASSGLRSSAGKSRAGPYRRTPRSRSSSLEASRSNWYVLDPVTLVWSSARSMMVTVKGRSASSMLHEGDATSRSGQYCGQLVEPLPTTTRREPSGEVLMWSGLKPAGTLSRSSSVLAENRATTPSSVLLAAYTEATSRSPATSTPWMDCPSKPVSLRSAPRTSISASLMGCVGSRNDTTSSLPSKALVITAAWYTGS
mmetsp:Transcript_7108/g.20145  ORF Transcript_7108/g.20145 Transcript_7108/m.20145 type:complete len:262 (-) Transcript_7108:168-953(-)